MRSGVLAIGLLWSSVAFAQPAPAPQPAPTYAQPATYPPPATYPQPAPPPTYPPSTYPGPPLAGYPGPQPGAPTPPPEPSAWTWSFGLGLATLAFDDSNGPCMSCDHGGIAGGIDFSVGYRIVPGISPFALLEVGITTAGGLGSDGNGDGGNIQSVAIFGGIAIEIAPRMQLLGGLGYGKLSYTWEERSDNFLFGSSTTDFDMDIGSGPAGLAGARFQIGKWGKLAYGLEGRLTVMRMKDIGEASLLSVGFAAGWL